MRLHYLLWISTRYVHYLSGFILYLFFNCCFSSVYFTSNLYITQITLPYDVQPLSKANLCYKFRDYRMKLMLLNKLWYDKLGCQWYSRDSREWRVCHFSWKGKKSSTYCPIISMANLCIKFVKCYMLHWITIRNIVLRMLFHS